MFFGKDGLPDGMIGGNMAINPNGVCNCFAEPCPCDIYGNEIPINKDDPKRCPEMVKQLPNGQYESLVWNSALQRCVFPSDLVTPIQTMTGNGNNVLTDLSNIGSVDDAVNFAKANPLAAGAIGLGVVSILYMFLRD